MPNTTMVGIMSGAVTNTPGLGVAQQAYSDMTGIDAPDIVWGYTAAYTLGVIGIILSIISLKTRPQFGNHVRPSTHNHPAGE